MNNRSGVGVIDKVAAILGALAQEPRSLPGLAAATSLPRPTAHRLAVALEFHGLVARSATGQFILGEQIHQWANPHLTWEAAADMVARELRDATGVSAQVYRRAGEQRLCIAAAEPLRGLRDTVPVGALLTMKAGSAAQVLSAWEADDDRRALLKGAAFTEAMLATVRKRGWAQSVAQREPGVASAAAPVRDVSGSVIGAISISGPADPLAKPSKSQISALLAAAQQLESAIAT
ncbi:MAG: IclR family transcriptional regulator C-terminal domain-containing protein [Actinomycetota bacterium]|nr:IclR family transcriptional regulator C-terminal domain-containing protein [Actinomycetota bacterium]